MASPDNAEFVARTNREGVYRNALSAVTVKPDAVGSRFEGVRFKTALAALVAKGWSRSENNDGSVSYRRPGASQPSPDQAFEAEQQSVAQGIIREVEEKADAAAAPATAAMKRAIKTNQRRTKARRPANLLEYIAFNGGIRDDEGHLLKGSRDAQRPIPGAGSLVRKNGNSVDDVGEILWQGGVLRKS